MSKTLLGQGISTRKLQSLKDSRHAERVAVNCRVTYFGEIPTQPHSGDGLTKDISLSGCKMVSHSPVTRGTLLTLTIALPDGLAPLRLFSTHVVWVSGPHFSVRFLQLSQENRKRLQCFILKHINHSTLDNQRARFQIA